MKSRRRPAAWLLDVAFFAGFLAYAYFGIDTRLIHHWQAPVFYFTGEFAREFLTYPGGLVDGIYALAAQAYASRWWGALLLTGQAAVAAILMRRWCGRAPYLRFAPAVVLLYAANLYYDRTPLALALLLALAASVPVVRGRPIWLAIILLPAVYWAGGMALVFLAVMAVAREIGGRRYWWAGAALVCAAALPLANAAAVRGWFLDADVRKTASWWSLYLVLAAAGFLSGRSPSGEVRLRRWVSAAAAAVVLLSLAGAVALAYRSNMRDRRLAAIDYHASQEDWTRVIDSAERLPAADFNTLTRYTINLALHESHRMGDEMFRFPQAESTLPRLRTETFLPYMIRLTDLFLRLGRINDAERFGYEAAILGQSDPRVLRLMARVHLVNGQTAAARKYLTILSGEAGSAGWARDRLRELIEDPDLARDAEAQILRRRMLRNDDVFPVWQNPEKPEADVNRLLLDLLEQDPSNRMAFEFLMGNYLLHRDLASARALAPRIREMSGPAYEGRNGSRRTPIHYQEAMAMYGDGAGAPVNLPGLAIEAETLNRMAVFKRVMAQSPGREAAKQAAWERFRHSYFFYFVFGPGDYR